MNEIKISFLLICCSCFKKKHLKNNRSFGIIVEDISAEVLGSVPVPAKSDTVSQNARHCCHVFSEIEAVLFRHLAVKTDLFDSSFLLKIKLSSRLLIWNNLCEKILRDGRLFFHSFED